MASCRRAGAVLPLLALAILDIGCRSRLGPAPALPPLALTTLAGRPASLSDYRGKVVLLDLWATWCPPCVESLPWLEGWHRKYQGKGLAVVGVSLDEGGATTVNPFVARRKLTYPMLLARSVESLDGQTLPLVYLLDRSGAPVARWSGRVDPDQVEAALVRLLSESP